jgi:hypothetical protein
MVFILFTEGLIESQLLVSESWEYSGAQISNKAIEVNIISYLIFSVRPHNLEQSN